MTAYGRGTARIGRLLVLLLLFSAASSCGGGGDEEGPVNNQVICLNCSGLSGNSRLNCEIQNSRNGC